MVDKEATGVDIQMKVALCLIFIFWWSIGAANVVPSYNLEKKKQEKVVILELKHYPVKISTLRQKVHSVLHKSVQMEVSQLRQSIVKVSPCHVTTGRNQNLLD